MKILITGADGQLGKELQKQLTVKKFDFTAVDLPEIDITDYDSVKDVVIDENPDVIINSAACNDVDGCEEDKEQAFQVNAIGPRNLAIMANKVDAKLVHGSTDYVFAGDATKSYKEYNNANPQTVYGRSKLMGEELVQKQHSKHFIIRTAWLYGDGDNFVQTMLRLYSRDTGSYCGRNGDGDNFVQTMLRLAADRDELDVVGDQIGSPTSTVDLARVIIELMQTEYYGVYHGTCEGTCSWYDFACKIFELKDIDIKVNEVTSEEFKRPAPRPKYSVLDNFMLKLHNLNLFRNWEEALKKYLEQGVK